MPQAGVAKPKPQLPKAVPRGYPGDRTEMAGHRWKCRESHEDVSEKRPIKSGWRQQAHGGGWRTGLAPIISRGKPTNRTSSSWKCCCPDFSSKEIEVTIQTVESSREFEDNYVDLSTRSSTWRSMRKSDPA